jgi:hypothetical protein
VDVGVKKYGKFEVGMEQEGKVEMDTVAGIASIAKRGGNVKEDVEKFGNIKITIEEYDKFEIFFFSKTGLALNETKFLVFFPKCSCNLLLHHRQKFPLTIGKL